MRAERARITARLETLLSVLGDRFNGTAATTTGEDLKAASDEELFEMIDKELEVMLNQSTSVLRANRLRAFK